jgi:hypothetical protein
VRDCSNYVNVQYIYVKSFTLSMCRDGLVGYDAALTRLRSGVRFPLLVLLVFFSFVSCFQFRCGIIFKNVYSFYFNSNMELSSIMPQVPAFQNSFTAVLTQSNHKLRHGQCQSLPFLLWLCYVILFHYHFSFIL